MQPAIKDDIICAVSPARGTKIDPVQFFKTSHPLNENQVICFHDWEKNGEEKKNPEKNQTKVIGNFQAKNNACYSGRKRRRAL